MISQSNVYGVDYGAVLSFAAAMGAPVDLVADLLPGVEAILVRTYRSEAEA